MNPAFLREALELARRGKGQTSPNPMVGAVLVRDDEVVGPRISHLRRPKPCRNPCARRSGRPCARGDALHQSGAVLAPGPHGTMRGRADCRGSERGWWRRWKIRIRESRGEGFRKLRAAGVEVELAGEFTAEAEKLNEDFVHFMRTGRPLVTLKTALTLDGKIAAPDDNRGLDHERPGARGRAAYCGITRTQF